MKRTLAAIALSAVAIAAIAMAVTSQKRRDETPAERFFRKGGKETKVQVFNDHGALTSANIAQKRDLASYDDGGLSRGANSRRWVGSPGTELEFAL